MDELDKRTLVARAVRALQSGSFDEVRQRCADLRARFPGDHEILYLSGLGHLHAGEPLEAIPFFQQASDARPDEVLYLMGLGLAFEHGGKPADTTRVMRRVLEIEPGYAEAQNLLGNALLALGQEDQAVQVFATAVQQNSRNFEACHALGRIARRRGAYAEAEASLQQAFALQPGNLLVLKELVLLYVVQGRQDKARHVYQAILARTDVDVDTWYDLGVLCLQQGDLEMAVETLQKAADRCPEDAKTLLALGSAYRASGHYDEALSYLERACRGMSGEGRAFHELALVYQKLGRHEDAIANYRRSIELEPDMAESHGNLGMVYSFVRQYDLAIAECQEAIRLNPQMGYPYGNLGNIAKSQGRIQDAIPYYRKGLELLPNDHSLRFALGFALLSMGHFEEGWKYYSSRPSMVDRQDVMIPTAPLPDDLAGKRILLVLDQGIGDEIFFLRFAYELKRRGAFLMYRPFKKTASLVARLNVIDHLVGRDESPADVDYAYSVGDLPRALGMRDDSPVPGSVQIPILPAALNQVRARLRAIGPGPYLGITWRAGVPKEVAARARKGPSLYKETPLGGLATMAASWPGQVLILQRMPKEGEIAEFARLAGKPAHDFTDLNEDLEQMLALMSCIDEYVGVSNTNMHLRAAVGKGCRVLVPCPPEWRWMASGHESPWFPGFTVYRESSAGGWHDALQEVQQDMLKKWKTGP